MFQEPSDAAGVTRSTPETTLRGALLGTAMHFSDQFVRIVNLEFSQMAFQRLDRPKALAGLRPLHFIAVHQDADEDIQGLVDAVSRHHPDAKVAVAYRDPKVVARLKASSRTPSLPGVSLLPMNVQLDVWFAILRLLCYGEDFFPGEILEAWRVNESPEKPRKSIDMGNVILTPREAQILPLVAAGRQNKCIARELRLSEHTVKLHLHNIIGKLKVRNRTHAAHWYLSHVQG